MIQCKQGLKEMKLEAAEVEESNALALVLVQPGKLQTANNCFFDAFYPSIWFLTVSANQGWDPLGETNGSGWELALVTAPSNNANRKEEGKLVCSFFST